MELTAKEFYSTMWNPLYVDTTHKQFSYVELIEFAEEYSKSKLSNIGRSKGDSSVTADNGNYTPVANRTSNGSETKALVTEALPPISEAKEFCDCPEEVPATYIGETLVCTDCDKKIR